MGSVKLGTGIGLLSAYRGLKLKEEVCKSTVKERFIKCLWGL